MFRLRVDTTGQDLPVRAGPGDEVLAQVAASPTRRRGAPLAPAARMAMINFTQAIDGRRTIARDEDERRRCVREIVATAGPRLLLFSLVDDHLHVVLRGDRLGYLVRDLQGVLSRVRPDLKLDDAHVKDVEGRSHLTSLVHYFLRQTDKHALAGVHPALYSGSCFQDLVGVRILQGFDLRGLRAELPRLSMRELCPTVGLSPEPLRPASDELLQRVGAARIADLAAATLGVAATHGPGRDRATVRARALAARLAIRLDFTPREVARHLGVVVRTVQGASNRDPDPVAERALRRRLTLEERAQGRL
jgi:hypothetical protein